jgi:hypothetical protein
MATDKYALPDYVTTRVRYYNGQFLRDDDFIAEQRYQIVERRRHERLLHIAGVTEGLDVTPVSGGGSVKVAAGSAIDDQGRAIRLDQDVTLPVTGSGSVYLELGFSEAETNPSDQNSSVQSNTRFTQNARPTLSTTRTAGTVLLAELSLTSSTITAVKLDNRVYSGLRLPGPAGTGGYLRSRGDANTGWAEMGCSLSVKGSMLVNGGVGFAGTGLNATDKKLFSPSDGLLRWQTHNQAASHAFEVGHQTDAAAVHLDTSGNSWLNGGNVAIGTTDPAGNKLRVNGTLSVDTDASVGGSLSFGSKTRQMLNLYGTGFALGVQSSTTYFRSSKSFAFYANGSHNDAELNSGGGTTLMVLSSSGPKLTISHSPGSPHMQLRREKTETTGGNLLFLELYQDDDNPAHVPAAYPSIRFHHFCRFYHRLEAREDGLHIKNGDTGNNNYAKLTASAVDVGLGHVVACQEETLRVIRGTVNSNGGINSGSGYSVSKVGTGLYDINFSTAFNTTPAVVITQIFEGNNQQGGDTRDNAVVVLTTTTKTRIKTGGSDGSVSDRSFCFVAFGT